MSLDDERKGSKNSCRSFQVVWLSSKVSVLVLPCTLNLVEPLRLASEVGSPRADQCMDHVHTYSGPMH